MSATIDWTTAKARASEIRIEARLIRARARTYARRFNYPKDLCGLCHIAALATFRKLGGHIEIDHAGEHCWAVVDGFVVDVTATQFDGPPVVVSAGRAQPYFVYTPGRVYKTERGFRNALREWDWPGGFRE